MDLGLEGRIALVTGGRRGIGAAVGIALAREGCHVALVDLEGGGQMDDVVRRIRETGRQAVAITADVRDFERAESVVREAAEALGGLDLVVLAAGIARDRVSWKMEEAEWDDVVDVNLKGSFNYARAATPLLREAGGGRIVLVSSINGLRGKFGQANYAASKAGLVGLAKTLALELARYRITVNVVAPGMVRTEMVQDLPDEVVLAALKETLLGRLAEPEDVAAVVAFLCSGPAGHVTGEVVRVDGGQYL